MPLPPATVKAAYGAVDVIAWAYFNYLHQMQQSNWSGWQRRGGARANTDGSVGSARVAYVVQFNWNANQSWAPLEATIEIVERPSGRMREVEKAYRKSALNGWQTGSVAVLVCSHFRKLFSKASLEINVKAQQMIKCLHSTTNANETLPLSELGLMSCMWFDSIRCELHIYFLS